MTTRLEIVDELVSDLKSKLTLTSPLILHGGVRVGVFDPDEFATLPAIGIWIIDDEIQDDLMDNVILRRLNMILYGYVDAHQTDNYTRFYKFIEDIEKFFYSSSNRNYQNTYLGKLVITYSGATEQTGTFVLNFSIIYSQSGLGS